MATINRDELALVFRNAYDKAARGVENDTTRTNDENDKKKIDSEQELKIFQTEVKNLLAKGKVDQASYELINGRISTVFSQINSIRKSNLDEKDTKMWDLSKGLNKKLNSINKKPPHSYLADYEKEHPIKSALSKFMNTVTFGVAEHYVRTEYNTILMSPTGPRVLYIDYNFAAINDEDLPAIDIGKMNPQEFREEVNRIKQNAKMVEEECDVKLKSELNQIW